jgi:cell shape-determining protein MreC
MANEKTVDLLEQELDAALKASEALQNEMDSLRSENASLKSSLDIANSKSKDDKVHYPVIGDGSGVAEKRKIFSEGRT